MCAKCLYYSRMATNSPRRKPVLRRPVRLNLRLEHEQLVAVNAYANARGLDTNKAVRDLLAIGLLANKQASAAAEAK